MRVGVNLLNFGPGTTPETRLAWAGRTEALGYHFLMVSDHVAITPDVRPRYPAPFYDPFVMLGWLAGVTRTVELGTTVVVLPYRHPLVVANMASAVDRLSGGRFILGVGAGWARAEFAALGVPFERRGALTDEFLAAIRTCWGPDPASHAGKAVAFHDVQTVPSLRAPHPPLWIGGASDAAIRRAVRWGDAWHPIRIRLDWFRDTGVPRLRAIAAAEGRPVPALCPRLRFHLTSAPLPDAERCAGEGTLEQVRTDLRALDALGVHAVLLDVYGGDPESTRDHDGAWRMFETLATRVVDLPRERLR